MTLKPQPFPNNGDSLIEDIAFDAATYVHQAAQLHQLTIPPEQMPGAVDQFERIQAIAHFVLDFPLPDTLEALPQFDP